mgnify:CR=1 FL=1
MQPCEGLLASRAAPGQVPLPFCRRSLSPPGWARALAVSPAGDSVSLGWALGTGVRYVPVGLSTVLEATEGPGAARLGKVDWERGVEWTGVEPSRYWMRMLFAGHGRCTGMTVG